jgi:hypothetical protein
MRTRHTPCEKDPGVETSWKGPGHAMPQRSPRDFPASQAFVERARKQEEAKNGVHCSIRLDGTLVGVLGFVHVDRSNRSCEMGYESAFRKGPAPARSPSSPWQKSVCIRRATHPRDPRCSSLEYRRYARLSRLVREAPRSSRCDAGLSPRTARPKRTAPWIAQSCQGRGIVPKATVALTDYAFLVWDMNRVEIRAQAAATRCPSQPASLDR